jgi:hypothetical protein
MKDLKTLLEGILGNIDDTLGASDNNIECADISKVVYPSHFDLKTTTIKRTVSDRKNYVYTYNWYCPKLLKKAFPTGRFEYIIITFEFTTQVYAGWSGDNTGVDFSITLSGSDLKNKRKQTSKLLMSTAFGYNSSATIDYIFKTTWQSVQKYLQNPEIAPSLIYAMFARKDFDHYGITLIDSYIKDVFRK